jgi:hypothetical protein
MRFAKFCVVVKGIVQRDSTVVKTRIKKMKRFVMTYYLVANIFMLNLKGHPEREVKSGLNILTCWFSSQNHANDGLRTMILEISLLPADGLTVQHLYRKSTVGTD